jgi:galactose mutarotase-like enzyme
MSGAANKAVLHTMNALTRIASAQLQAEIAPLGAQLFSLRDARGRELQWGGDPTIWKGRAPILFPIVGALAGGHYRVDGGTYAMSRHGFARDRLFTLASATPSRALLRLEADDQTLRLYPFRFALTMDFAITGARLEMIATVINLEPEKILPASFGFHPAFAWPLPFGQRREAHIITFETEEPAPIRRLDSDGLLLPQHFPTPVKKRVLVLSDELFTQDALIFDHIVSRRLTYGAPHGPHLDIEFPHASELGVWTKPGANFLCIEPWNGFSEPQGFDGDFRDKPGIFLVPPGQSVACTMAISVQG